MACGRARSALGSGIEESLEAVNEQSHYETLAGLVRQYVMLEDAFNDDKMDRIIKKRRMKLAPIDARQKLCKKLCVRRALRGSEVEPDANLSDTDHFNDTCFNKSTPAKA
ncbi:hypothetical protein GQ600_26349 [Phytophthora cactorum]|nr:hypothetical protein GQ600_26349 [Phytophthora cactorum]